MKQARQRLHNNAHMNMSIRFHWRGAAFTWSIVFLYLNYQQKLIMHVECARGRAVFGKHSRFSTMCCRKCNFMLIDVEVGLLLTFFAGTKAKVHLYQSMYPFLHVCTWKVSIFQVSIFKVSSLVTGFKCPCFACAFSSLNYRWECPSVLN